MATNYAQMTAELIARMSRPQEHVLCPDCHSSISENQADDGMCALCSADDACDDIELEAVTRPLAKALDGAEHA